jgi:hypothetical protein
MPFSSEDAGLAHLGWHWFVIESSLLSQNTFSILSGGIAMSNRHHVSEEMGPLIVSMSILRYPFSKSALLK